MSPKELMDRSKPKRDPKRQIPLALLGAVLGAFVALNFVPNSNNPYMVMAIGAFLGGIGAFFYG
ncbi:MAG: hypothetical protein HPY50_13655 [Firmicutes bacterium]|nr:hypothetical protein [Bacillota bacterium]